MRPNYALTVLWMTAVVGVLVGAIMVKGNQEALAEATRYRPVNPAWTYVGSGLISLGVMCAIGALVAMAIGTYIQNSR